MQKGLFFVLFLAIYLFIYLVVGAKANIRDRHKTMDTFVFNVVDLLSVVI